MKSIFAAYPSLVFKLVGLFLLLNISHNFHSRGFTLMPYDEAFSNTITHLGHFFLFINGLTIIIAGLLVDQMQRTKTGFEWAIIIFCAGIFVAAVPFPWASLLSMVLVGTGLGLFTLLSYLHIAVLFPVATDLKDNAFLILLLAVDLSSFLSYLLSGLVFHLLQDYLVIFLHIGIIALLSALISGSREIGYALEVSPEEEKATLAKWPILIGATVFHFVVMWGTTQIPELGRAELTNFDFDTRIFYLIAIGGGIIYLSFILWIFRTAQSASRQSPKLVLGLGLLIALSILEFMVRGSQSYALDHFTDRAGNWIYILLFLPALLSIITHINSTTRAGLWLGVFLGAPNVLMYLLHQLEVDQITMSLLAVFMVIAAFIWMQQNLDWVRQLLQLEVANQEMEEEELGEDPFDHFIG